MTPIDSLYVGNWIAITRVVPEEREYSMFMPWAFNSNDNHPPVDGRPLRILAISLPFICVTDGRYKFSLNVRRCEVQKLHRTYVRQMFGALVSYAGVAACELDEDEEDEDTPDDKTGCCPVCGGHLIQLLHEGSNVWMLACKECGFQGGRPTDRGGV